ncbi:uncharacterized protein N7477_007073 [Penicillium maclennaniae]|uniref:uncharacterized protein n=1 Tax=Penicillium maclennaniae TaxID=1343394 RepID=UPI0025423C6D|nr:uncharacterized protein N7477_007073 [Penicillium maclennaniae]KAJ5668503.1 hypothetical protein N7477_007073 [Penicillium maclennaniae]
MPDFARPFALVYPLANCLHYPTFAPRASSSATSIGLGATTLRNLRKLCCYPDPSGYLSSQGPFVPAAAELYQGLGRLWKNVGDLGFLKDRRRILSDPSSSSNMTASQLEPVRVHPRRRPVLNSTLPTLDTEDVSSKMCLKKGETFNTPTSPPSAERDPILNIRSLPRRSPTSLDGIAASEQRMASILERLTLEDGADDSNASQDDFSQKKSEQPVHSHESDSGLGSSVSSAESVDGKVTVDADGSQSAITGPIPAAKDSSRPQLGLAACKQIERFILVPLLKEPKLKPFHPLVQSVPARIVNKQITCLRDLEKTLLWLAPKLSTLRSAYLNFAEFTIQCLHTSASHLNDRDQRLPADRPYTNGYFLDLVSQVRRYAALIRSNRERVEAAPAQESPNSKAEKKEPAFVPTATLEGGMSQNGKPAELVVVQEDGKAISMATGLPYDTTTPASFKRAVSFDEKVDEGVQRSMARRKKNAPPMDINQKCNHCDKVFKRPCDLTKHEKTHSRPWKCSESTCKYFEVGWPTEKERDRHVNDKHSDTPSLYKCQFQPCTYASKRESNCKQHMEKAHGWVYVRSKNNARGGSTGKRGSSVQATPGTPSVSTPASRSADFSTPFSAPSASPQEPPFFQDNVPFNFNDPPVPVRSDDFPPLFENSPYHTSSVGMGNEFTFPTSMNLDAFQTQFEAGEPDGLIPALEMHRQSMNSMSIPSADVTFDLDWSRLDYNSMQEDVQALNIQLPTPSSDHSGLKPYVDNPMRATNYMGYEAPSKVSGLSPNAQGNLMLYSPRSGQADEQYDYRFQSPAGNDFTLYDQTHRMSMNAGSHVTPPMTQQASPGQYAPQPQPAQPMFPPLDRDAALQDIKSWAEQSQHGSHYDPYMGPNGEYEYMK